MVSLRMSAEEYEALKRVYAAHGVRSVSEFARVAMHNLLDGKNNGHPPTLESRFTALDGKVAGLQTELARLSHVVEQELIPAKKA